MDIEGTVLFVLFIVLPLLGFIIFLVVYANKNYYSNHSNKKIYFNDNRRTIRISDLQKLKSEKPDRSELKDCKNVLYIIRKILNEVITYHETQKKIVENDISSCKKEIVKISLSNTDISKINRNRSRIDVAALRRARINTLHDLDKYSNSLTWISGIGQRSNDAIDRNLREIKNELFRSAIIRLSYDNRTRSRDDLVLSIAVLLESEKYDSRAKELLKIVSQINVLLNTLKKQISFFNKNKKSESHIQKTLDLYKEIMDLYNSNFLDFNEALIDPFNKTKRKTVDEAWDNFKNNPIAFNKIIELFSTNRYGSEKEYGLSVELANKIKNTPLNLDGMKLSLRTYQEWGTKYIISQKRTILGDEMGLGKTVQAIAAMVSLKNEGKTHFCVVCPLSVLTNWCREIERFSSLNRYRVHGQYKKYYFRQWLKNGGVMITTYETIDLLPLEDISNIDYLVVDEAHFVKNPKTKRSENVGKLLYKSDYVTYLTGTVLENRVDEMITLISQIRPEVFKEVNQYATTQTKDTFKEKVSSTYFRRKRTDVLNELPEKTEINEWCDLSYPEITYYDQTILSRSFVHARRVSWNAGPSLSTKMKRLKEIVEVAKEEDRKVLVFSYFLKTIYEIKQEYGDAAYGPITGKVSSNVRQAIIDNFSKAKAGSILICQIQSGGIGLNIQSASVVIICEPQLKPSIENQAISRAYRMGQPRDVFVHRLLASDSIDERLEEMLNRKQNEFNNFADTSLMAEESFKIDSEMFTNIMNKEYERIENKYKNDDIVKPNIVLEKIEEDSNNNETIDAITIIEKNPNIKGASVTGRISNIIQPRGGLLSINAFSKTQLNPSDFIDGENVNAGLVGLAVDYLTRFMNGASAKQAFEISLKGAKNVSEEIKANSLVNEVKGLDDESIKTAIKLTGYDVAFRSNPMAFVPIEEINPDERTINNVREMVNRSLNFLKEYGPVVKDGFTFEGGYTETISSGDGDYMTSDTIWDFKVYKKEPTSNNTLQLLIYYLMGQHSIYNEFKNIKYIGFYNPRKNIVYRYQISKISRDIISIIESKIIKY